MRRPLSFSLAFAALAFPLSSGLPGCGGGKAEFHKDAADTPESLAQDFLFRYKALPDRQSAREKARTAALEKARAAVPDIDAQTKSARAEAAVKKASGPTLERLIDETQARIARIPGLPRAEASRKFVDALSKEGTIAQDDLRLIRESLPQ
jgi:hypothetical protein